MDDDGSIRRGRAQGLLAPSRVKSKLPWRRPSVWSARYIALFVRFVNISEGRRREAERVSRSRNKLVVRKEEEEAWWWW